MVGLCYFNDETVGEVDCYPVQGAKVRQEVKRFPQNFMSQRDLAPPHFTHMVSFIMDEIFPNSWTRRYGAQAGQKQPQTYPGEV